MSNVLILNLNQKKIANEVKEFHLSPGELLLPETGSTGTENKLDCKNIFTSESLV